MAIREEELLTDNREQRYLNQGAGEEARAVPKEDQRVPKVRQALQGAGGGVEGENKEAGGQSAEQEPGARGKARES